MSTQEEMVGLIQLLVNQVNSDKLQALTVEAYDTCAMAAMQEIINATGFDSVSDADGRSNAAAIAKHAWLLADAMMLERAKRGLGQIIAVPMEIAANDKDTPPDGMAS